MTDWQEQDAKGCYELGLAWKRVSAMGNPWTVGELQRAHRMHRDGWEFGTISVVLDRPVSEIKTAIGEP